MSLRHKTLYLSSAQDSSPFGRRLTYCRKEIPSIEPNARWENVTCEKCWAMKNIVPVRRKPGPKDAEKGYKFLLNENGFVDRSRRVWV